jgi:hypothetical protein
LLLCTLACAWGGAGALGAAGQPKYVPVVKTVKPAGLAKAMTYSWTQRQPAFDKKVDAWIVGAVDRELGSRGLTKLAEGPADMVVTYASLTRTDVDLKSKTTDGLAREYAVGTLVVDLSDAATQQTLFRVQVDTPIERDPAGLEAIVNTAVKSIFDKYPAPSKR